MDYGEVDAGTLEESDALRKLKQDYVSELLGWPSGRLRRFFFHASDAAYGDPDHDENAEFTRAMLAQIVCDQNQRRIERLQSEAVLAETASYEALIAAREKLAETMQRLNAMLEQAHQLPDGRRVFLSEDGSYAIDEDLNQLTDNEMDEVEWEAGRTTAEDYSQTHADEAAALQDVRDIEKYRQQLEDNREKLGNKEPITGDDIAAIEDDIAAMPDSVRERYDRMGGSLRVEVADAANSEHDHSGSVKVSTSVVPTR